jgi:hypothetical protein
MRRQQGLHAACRSADYEIGWIPRIHCESSDFFSLLVQQGARRGLLSV